MCGFCGVVDLRRATSTDELTTRVDAMAATLVHRGPDDAGRWVDAEAGVALGHRRLSVVDLSAAGHQPMVSGTGRYVLVYNGEVYDHRELAATLRGRGHRFHGHSDTEVLLAAIEEWGLAEALARSNAMFALALWDRRERRLQLARDRVGEKPLVWGRFGATVVFASELKALRAHPAVPGSLDRDALTLYFRHKYVPAPHTVYRDVVKVEPGEIVTIAADGATGSTRFWDLPEPGSTPVPAALPDLVDHVESVLRDAVRLRLDADVPVGAFLSGGLDSTAVVALAQEVARGPVRTFTIANEDPRFDESAAASAVATHLGTDHTSLRVTGADALGLIPGLAEIWDEPFADSSQLPTLLVARLARDQVTVAISGDGGDELFGGYNRYRWVPAIWARTGRFPAGMRRLGGRVLGAVPPRWWDGAGRLVPERRRPRLLGTKITKVAQVVGQPDPAAMYLRLTSHWDQPERLVLGGHEPRTLVSSPERWPAGDTLAQRMMAVDLATYLPDDILVKLDRATMAVSLEGRVPLLDHRVVSLARSLPADALQRDGRAKWLLHRIASRHVPPEVLDRPKMGFGVPVGGWLRGPLRPWAEELLDGARLRREGVLDADQVRTRWQRHVQGRADHTYELWDVLMFQAWLERWA